MKADDEILDVLFDEFLRAHPHHVRADRGLSPESYDAWTSWLSRMRGAAEALRDKALQELETNETPLARKLRTGVESSENWMADELQAWLRAGRSEAEFAEAFAPEPDEELLPVTLKLLRGV